MDVSSSPPELPPSLQSDSIRKSSSELSDMSFIFGLLSIPFGIVVIGIFSGALAIVLAFFQLAKKDGNTKKAYLGICFSLVGCLISLSVIWAITGRISYIQKSLKDSQQDLAFWEGIDAIDFTAEDVDGNQVSLSDYAGQRVVVAVVQPDLLEQLKSSPDFSPWVQLAAEDLPDVRVICLVYAEPGVLSGMRAKSDVSYDLISIYNYWGVPTPFRRVENGVATFVIDRNGVIQSVLHNEKNIDVLRAAATASDYQGIIKDAPPSVHKPLPVASDLWVGGITRKRETDPPAYSFDTFDWDGDGSEEVLWIDDDGVFYVAGDSLLPTFRSEWGRSGDELVVARRDGQEHICAILEYDDDDEATLIVLEASGQVLWEREFADSASGMMWFDIDSNGNPDLLVADDYWLQLRVFTYDGKRIWKSRFLDNVWSAWPVRLANGDSEIHWVDTSNEIQVFSSVGKDLAGFFRADGEYDTIVGASNDDDTVEQLVAIDNGRMVGFDADGTQRWTGTIPGGHGTHWYPLDAGDFNNDGQIEWVLAIEGPNDFVDDGDVVVVISLTGEIIGTYIPSNEIFDLKVQHIANEKDLVLLDMADTINTVEFFESEATPLQN